MANTGNMPTVVTRGDISEASVSYARDKLLAVASATTVPVLRLEVRLDHHADRAHPRPNHVELSIDLDGTPVRAHDSAPTMTEAVDAAAHRLRRNVEVATERAQSLQFRHRAPDEWRHGDRAADRGDAFPRPAGEREVVRRKTFALRSESIEDALFDLERLDHRFFLFVHDETAEDAVVWRTDNGYELMQRTPTPEAIARSEAPVRAGPSPATMPMDDALTLLDETDAPFVFFFEPGARRGCVVYRRYDGNYGVIVSS
jgi:ribosome-associated translation inhibitor RaiA